jgi:4-amino-4-deoxy-L-arabinose transferase-like glycosyltransferase
LLDCTAPMAPLLLFAIAFFVRMAVAAVFTGPAYPDSYYYVHVAQQLAAGHGFVVDYLWNLGDIGGRLPVAATLPVAANGYWMPLAELVQVPFVWLLGPSWIAAELPFWIVGALAAPLTYWIGRDAGFERWAATAAGLLAAVPGALTPFLAQPDNFGLYMTLGALSLWLCARGLAGDRRAFVAGGLVVGLATLARSDGILLGLPFALVGLHDLLRRDRARVGLFAAAGCAIAFAIVLGPWLYRQVAVFGGPVPFADGGHVLWLTDYQQLFSLANPASADGWLAQGLPTIVTSRVSGLIAALGLFALLPLVVVLAPFALIGWWQRRSDEAFLPFSLYCIVLFLISGLLFAVLVAHGTFMHSAVALLPHTALLTIAGIGAAVAWVGRHRRSWDVRRATTIFSVGAVVIAIVAGGVQTLATTAQWHQARELDDQMVAALSGTPQSDVVMSADPGAVWYLSGHPGVVTPADSLPIVEETMRSYDVRWLILDRANIMPAFVPILTGEIHPAWLSRPVAVISGQPADSGAAGEAMPQGAVYAVCLTPGDARCAS